MSDKYNNRVRSLLEDRNHGVLLSALTLLKCIMKQTPEAISEFADPQTGIIQTLVRTLKNLLMSGYANAAEYDVAGVTDPFLQCQILHILGMLGAGRPDASEEMNDVLAQVRVFCVGWIFLNLYLILIFCYKCYKLKVFALDVLTSAFGISH